jgi:hypothetical protein
MMQMSARIGAVICWPLSDWALLMIAAAPGARYSAEVRQILGGAIIYFIGRDMRRVLRE